MPVYIAKIEKNPRQYRITIPKELAQEAGLYRAQIVRLSLTQKNTIEIEGLNVEKQTKIRE